MMAKKHDLKVLKFFPANVYGGLKALKSLSGPFPGTKFIPTGGVSNDNLAEFISNPIIHAVGGSWTVPKKEINEGNFAKITELCAEARKVLLGFEILHVGINCDDADTAMEVAEKFQEAFGFTVKPGNSSNFAGTAIEVMKSKFLGAKGHIAIRTNKIEAAIAELEKHGFTMDMSTAKYKADRLTVVYLKDEIGGFAVHLSQK
jgi:2-dehydro-3-deoxyphosphogluconate aldolase/(4S)-4-hydroxy-2-oxoglutarate aldolase